MYITAWSLTRRCLPQKSRFFLENCRRNTSNSQVHSRTWCFTCMVTTSCFNDQYRRQQECALVDTACNAKDHYHLFHQTLPCTFTPSPTAGNTLCRILHTLPAISHLLPESNPLLPALRGRHIHQTGNRRHRYPATTRHKHRPSPSATRPAGRRTPHWRRAAAHPSPSPGLRVPTCTGHMYTRPSRSGPDQTGAIRIHPVMQWSEAGGAGQTIVIGTGAEFGRCSKPLAYIGIWHGAQAPLF